VRREGKIFFKSFSCFIRNVLSEGEIVTGRKIRLLSVVCKTQDETGSLPTTLASANNKGFINYLLVGMIVVAFFPFFFSVGDKFVFL
jgi:hypothetical protein